MFFTDLRESASQIKYMLVLNSFYHLKDFISISSWIFTMKGCRTLSETFSEFIKMTIQFFEVLIGLCMLKHPYILGRKPT